MYIFFNNTLYDTKSLSYRSRWKPPWERWLLGYTRMWCSLPGVKYIYEQWFVENNSVCLIEPTVIWHTKNECTLWQYRVHAIASIYFPDFLDILPCLIQSQVGQILSPPTNRLIRYLIINLPNSVKKKKYMHYQMTEFCGNFYINPIFKKYFQPVS